MKNRKYWEERAKERLSKYWKDADSLDLKIEKEYAKTLKELEKEFLAFSNKYGIDGKLNYSQKRILELMKQINDILRPLSEQNKSSFIEHLSEIYQDNRLKTLYEISKALQVSAFFTRIPQRQIATAIDFPWYGASFSDRLYNNKNKLLFNLKSSIVRSLIRGENPNETAKGFAKEMKISYNDAKRLLLTETATVISTSTKKCYEEYEIEKYVYVATLDKRTSETCKNLDNKIFDAKDYTIGINAPPMHAYCRSTTVPADDSISTTRIAKRLDTGEYESIDSDITYRAWERKFVK